jgi:hypothetical protein
MIRLACLALLFACALSAQAKVLYTGTSLPGSQGWFGPIAGTQALDAGGFVSLNTSVAAGLQGGYGLLEPLQEASPGFRIDFTARLESEAHSNNDRAGFSMIVTDGTKHGIELGFWQNHIWAQQPGFTHGDDVAFTTTAMTDYSLTVIGNTYRLTAGGATLLSGATIFYDAPGLPFFPAIPYRTPHVLFFGDDTTSASAKFDLKSVSIVAVPEPATALLLCGGVMLLVLARRDSGRKLI